MKIHGLTPSMPIDFCEQAYRVEVRLQRRFWELDDEIYGGISWTSREITQIWYPSAGFHEPKGILVGAYIWSADLGDAFAAQAPPLRIETALVSGERIHRGYRGALRSGISVAWSKIPFSRGAWAEWSAALRRDAYPLLLQFLTCRSPADLARRNQTVKPRIFKGISRHCRGLV